MRLCQVQIRCCGCSRSRKLFIAERETVTCLSPVAHGRRLEAIVLFREKAQFALKMAQREETLPHGKEAKVECGAMLGLQAAIHGNREPVEDIHSLFESAMDRYGDMRQLPYSEIIKAISHFKLRKPRR